MILMPRLSFNADSTQNRTLGSATEHKALSDSATATATGPMAVAYFKHYMPNTKWFTTATWYHQPHGTTSRMVPGTGFTHTVVDACILTHSHTHTLTHSHTQAGAVPEQQSFLLL